MARKTRKSWPAAYVLKVTLMQTDPPIWRRLRVAGDTTLTRLDRIIQAAMGWTNSHLHTFTAGGVVYAQPDPEGGIEIRDERRVRLDQIVKQEGEAFVYEYDLGDSWATSSDSAASATITIPGAQAISRAVYYAAWSTKRAICGGALGPVVESSRLTGRSCAMFRGI